MTSRTGGHQGAANKLLLAFAAASLLAVAMGCVAASAAGVGAASWGRNLIAWVVGALAAVALSRRPFGDALVMPIAAAAIAGLAATFVNAGQDGVHRWWDVGPLHVNAAALILPVAIVALARSDRLRVLAGASLMLAALLAAQPDASQATALGAAMSIPIARRRDWPAWRWAVVALLIAVACLSWLRPDPLAPVPEVEEIIQLAWKAAPLAGALGVLALSAACLAPLLARGASGHAASALSVYAVISALAPLFGAFPVPLMGIGMSAIVGLWLGVGLLAAPARLA